MTRKAVETRCGNRRKTATSSRRLLASSFSTVPTALGKLLRTEFPTVPTASTTRYTHRRMKLQDSKSVPYVPGCARDKLLPLNRELHGKVLLDLRKELSGEQVRSAGCPRMGRVGDNCVEATIGELQSSTRIVEMDL